MKSAAAVLIVTVVYLVTALITTLLFDNKEFLFYLAAAPFIVGGVAALHRKAHFPTGLLAALSFLGLLHVLGGLVSVPQDAEVEGKRLLYNLWIIKDVLKFDQVVHAYGNGVATWFCWHLLRYAMSELLSCEVKDVRAKPAFLLVCFLAGLGVGAFNEVGEFGTTQIVEENNVGGYENTGWDLVANTVGSATAVTLIWIKRRNGRLVTKPSSKKAYASAKN